MVDPWGPGVKRNVESADSWIKSWDALGSELFAISALRNKQGPIFIQEQFQYIIQAMDSLKNLHFLVNTSGEVTESNASGILARGNEIISQLRYGDYGEGAYYGVKLATSPPAAQKRRFALPLAEAAGSIAATTIVPALAGHTSHCEVQGFMAPAGTTDAASDWVFSVAAGSILGPAAFDMNITAERYHNFTAGVAGVSGPPVPLRGTLTTDDNKDIQVTVTNLAAVTITYWIDGVYWYE